jgi:hypothetical protein
MTIFKIIFLLAFPIPLISLVPNDQIKLCGLNYEKERKKIFLKDEDLSAEMINVIDPKSKKLVFGYYKKAIRNDTNFIYSKLSQVGDTLYNTTYHRYNISHQTDSTISKYICSPRGIIFYQYVSFWNGKIKSSEIFNKKIG